MRNSNTQLHLRYTILAALFAAMVYVLTAFVHIPTQQGYVHVGDSVIYLAASLLPMPYAIAASAIGAGLSDFLSGYAMWVVPTILIKSMTAAVFSSQGAKIIRRRNLLAIIPAGVICVAGYYIAGALLALLSGTPAAAAFTAALADIPTNLIQVAGSSVLYVVLGTAMDKAGIKRFAQPKGTV